MLNQSARVVAATRDGLWVEARRADACRGCGGGTSCGQALRGARSTSLSLLRLTPPAGSALTPGATVTLSVPESLVLKLSLLFYLLPLAALLGGALLAARVGGGEVATVLGAVAGLCGGALAARGLARRIEARSDILSRIHLDAAPSRGNSPIHETES